MKKAAGPIEKFSSFLDLPPLDMGKAELLDQPLYSDAKYYIDILKFKDVDIPEFKDSYSSFLTHFRNFFQLVRISKDARLAAMNNMQIHALSDAELRRILREADAPFKGAFNALNFKELDGFNLGYSKSLRGSSIGPKFKFFLIRAAQELISLNISDPEVFCLLPFIQEGIGCDRISDMFISINYKHFLKYTERKLRELGYSKTKLFELDGEQYQLTKPTEFKNPLILVPRRLVKRLPFGFSWDDIFCAYDENTELRVKLNKIILSNIEDKKDITKAKVSSLLKDNPSLLRQIVQEFKETTSFSQMDKALLEDVEKELDELDPPKLTTLTEQVHFILNKFKWFVEKKATWRLLYQKASAEGGEKIKHPLSEDHAQRAFFIVAEILSEKFGIEVIPEADTGVGVVDFKFCRSREKVLVEVKLSVHKQLVHGFETQLAEYIAAEAPEHSFYLVILVRNADPQVMETDMGRLERLDALHENHPVAKKSPFLVDALPKVSASKK